MPALPLHEAGKYVAGAYLVLFVLVLVYVAIMAIRLSRMERELGELLARGAGPEPPRPGEPTDLGRPQGTPHPEPTPYPESTPRPESTPV